MLMNSSCSDISRLDFSCVVLMPSKVLTYNYKLKEGTMRNFAYLFLYDLFVVRDFVALQKLYSCKSLRFGP
jgi:hypothetical protein